MKRYTAIPRRKDTGAAKADHGDMFNPTSRRFTMTPWIKRTLIGLFGASVLFGGLAACSHRPHGPGGWSMSEADSAQMRERIIDKATRELSLDEAQKAKLGTLADAVKAQRAALMAGGTEPRAELQSLVAGAQFDRAKAQSLIESKTAAVRDKSPAVVTAMADFYDSLKPEQQQKVRDFMARGRGHRGWRG
ncbi:Spy/CpxP family protein refolding chaperone [Ideonella sp. A 288]|uniref:Spy/CpxP family protein refolding chaperone n=1 Tax=Ideonella sp. A 288 TaxID=1962181 RepID=UPI00287371F8|nr:Spy/CpxP family protein refolding chaperone [Ideonella sp. A 288]